VNIDIFNILVCSKERY